MNAYEWLTDKNFDSMIHDSNAIEMAQYMANFFVKKGEYIIFTI